MAFGIKNSETIEVIFSGDESVQCSAEEYDKYLEDLDETRLNLNPDIAPTRFVMKREMDYEASKRIEDQKISYKDGAAELRLGFMLEEVRCTLTDIKNPGEGLEFKKESDGKYAAKSLIQKLNNYGVVSVLHTARRNALTGRTLAKKSSPHSLSSVSPTM